MIRCPSIPARVACRLIPLLLACGAAAQGPALTQIPELAEFYAAVPALESGLDNQDTNEVAQALLEMFLIDESLSDAMDLAVARAQAAGREASFPNGTRDDLLELNRLLPEGAAARLDAMVAASVYITTLDSNTIVEAQSNLVDAVNADTALANKLQPVLNNLSGMTVPADLFLTVENDPESRPGDTAGVRVRVANVGDQTAVNVSLGFKSSANASGVEAELSLGDIEAGEQAASIFFTGVPGNRDSVGLLVRAFSETTETTFAYEVILVNTNAP